MSAHRKKNTRRKFLSQAGLATGGFLWPGIAAAFGKSIGPGVTFPVQARERIAIASYPFREAKIDLRDFAAHCKSKFDISKIEPWSPHFGSLEPKYLEEVRAAVKRSGGAIVNIAVDGEHSPYAGNAAEREKAVALSMQWIDAAVIVGSPSVRTSIPPATDSTPHLERAVESLRRVAEHAAEKKVTVHLENDNAVSEDPFFLVQLIDKVESPWLHALPDFANTLTTGNEERAYRGVDLMFGHAYGICHVKAMEANEQGQVFHVDMAKTFAMLKSHAYKGYCSMEFDSPGDPYEGTAQLIKETLKYL